MMFEIDYLKSFPIFQNHKGKNPFIIWKNGNNPNPPRNWNPNFLTKGNILGKMLLSMESFKLKIANLESLLKM